MAQQDNTQGASGMAGMDTMGSGNAGGKGRTGQYQVRMQQDTSQGRPSAGVTTAAQAKTSVVHEEGMSGESMQQMPMLRPKRVWTASRTQDWDALRGFGAATGMIAMMNGMMVGGSPMQNMKMGKMDISMTEMPAPSPEEAQKPSEASEAASAPASASAAKVVMAVSPNPPIVGENTLMLTVKDAHGQPVPGLLLAASVAMISMDMGTTTPPIRDRGNGTYTLQANFGMAGPWRVTIDGGAGTVGIHETYKFDAGSQSAAPTGEAAQGSSAQGPQVQSQQTQTHPAQLPSEQQAAGSAAPISIAAAVAPSPPKVGSNTMIVALRNGAGRPVTGATVTATVVMTTMDMGTTHPAFKDVGGGKYQGKVGFSMAGPWRVTITAIAPSGKAQTKSFVLTAK